MPPRGLEAGSQQGAPKRAPVRNQRSCAVYQTGVFHGAVAYHAGSGSERLSSGGAAVNSVRLSLLLACTAVCAAPGLLPVAGFPQRVTTHVDEGDGGADLVRARIMLNICM